MRKAATEFMGRGVNESNKKQQALTVFLLNTRDQLLDDPDDIWVESSDVSDAILCSGVYDSPEEVGAAIRRLRHFLPGCVTGKFSLQVSSFDVMCE